MTRYRGKPNHGSLIYNVAENKGSDGNSQELHNNTETEHTAPQNSEISKQYVEIASGENFADENSQEKLNKIKVTKVDYKQENPKSSVTSQREGDTGRGRPHPAPLTKDDLPRDYLEVASNINNQEESEESDEFDKKLSGSILVPKIITKILRCICWFFVGVIGLFLVAEFVDFVLDVSKLPLIISIICSFLFLGFASVLFWIIIKIIILLRRLRVSPQFEIKAIQELEERKHLRQLCIKKKREAVEKLCGFLEDGYDIKAQKKFLKKLGVNQEKIKVIEKHRDSLIYEAKNLHDTSESWLNNFNVHFQSQIDDIAKSRIRKYSVNVGLLTGASSVSIIDRLIAFSFSMALLKELLEIYSLKPSWDKSLALMARVIINTYLSGALNDIVEDDVDILDGALQGSLEELPIYASKVVGKSAEVFLQGYMIYRLGNVAIKTLRPIK